VYGPLPTPHSACEATAHGPGGGGGGPGLVPVKEPEVQLAFLIASVFVV
jgi:hypothetical protein